MPKVKKNSKKGQTIQRGKRKESIARCTVVKGTGKVFINGIYLNDIDNPLYQEIVQEPFVFCKDTTHDFRVNVFGGGTMSQAQAVRTAIARSLSQSAGNDEVRKQMMELDRSLLVEDSRRVEPKKFKGPGARARFTKSYR
ncbi:30S ribosomal protein S9 [uncultured archaeon]|nr:30S ribosomal protein S9 [uncultured archaeon]